MIVLDCVQGSAQWHFARLGIPTASQFSRIMSSKTFKLLEGSRVYMHELLAEWLVGMPCGAEGRGLMERGTGMESWAVGFYEMQRDVTTTPVGVCLLDNQMAACSPDRLVGEDGGMEVKCPGAPKHVANLLGMADDYNAQVQGNLWITGRAWWDLVSYHPEIPPAIVRVERDDGHIAALEAVMEQFIETLLAAQQSLLARGVTPATELAPEFAASLAVAEPEGI